MEHAGEQFAGLYPRGPSDAGGQGRHGAEARKFLRQVFHKMPGDEEKIRCFRTDGVGGHLPVAQARHEDRAGVRQTGQLAQQSRDRAGGAKQLLPALGQGGKLQGEIRPHGLAQGLGPGLVQDIHAGEGIAEERLFPGTDTGKLRGFPGGGLEKLLGLQGQVAASAVVHGRLLSAGPQDIVAAHDGFY